jgi:hypothetical protein
VARLDHRRLAALEARLGAKLPSDYLATLTEREPVREGDVAVMTPGRTWDVRSTFGLDDGDTCDQLDGVYGRVGDVLPAGMVPVAADWAGNFYCLVLTGPEAGRVVWWDHERDPGDHTVEPVAASVAEFYARLAPEPGG